jgi:hypothetical protein
LEKFELINEDMFDDLEQAIPVMWWLVHLLGGKVAFPMEEAFWLENYPKDSRLILKKDENGNLAMYAEKLDWQ